MSQPPAAFDAVMRERIAHHKASAMAAGPRSRGARLAGPDRPRGAAGPRDDGRLPDAFGSPTCCWRRECEPRPRPSQRPSQTPADAHPRVQTSRTRHRAGERACPPLPRSAGTAQPTHGRCVREVVLVAAGLPLTLRAVVPEVLVLNALLILAASAIDWSIGYPNRLCSRRSAIR